MRVVRPLVAGLLTGLALAAAAAPALPLAALEAAAVEHALQARLPAAQVAGLEQGLEAVQAQAGARLQAGAGLAHVREPLTETNTRRYERGQAQIGLRWPLLGSREAGARAVDEARLALALARLEADEAQAVVRRQVRRGYLELVAARQRAALARVWLGAQPGVAQALGRRAAAGLLLPADQLAFQTQADTVERDLRRQEVLARAAQRELAAWTGPAAADLGDPARVLDWPRWPAATARRCWPRSRASRRWRAPAPRARRRGAPRRAAGSTASRPG
jgi:outer membrane protein TolC